MDKEFTRMVLSVNLLDASIKDACSIDDEGQVTATISIPVNKNQGMSNNSMELIEPLFECKEKDDYFDIVAKVRIIKTNRGAM